VSSENTKRSQDWSQSRVKFIAELNPSKSEVAKVSDDKLVTFLPMEAIGENGELDLSKARKIGELRNGYTYLSDGDVCIAKITPCFENGKGAVIQGCENGIAFGTTEIIPLRSKPNTSNRFLYYFLKSPPFNIDAESSMYGAGGQKRVADSFVANYQLKVPPLEEQTKIAQFLDYETAKIDALIDKQQQLIALLKEKRQAVISHAVTKGLNPNAPMRDSGIEWLGEVPAHWKITKAKHLFQFVTSGSRGWAEYYSDHGNLFFRIANLTRDTIEPKLDSVQNVTPPAGAEGERSRIKIGDLLISITADLGSICVANQDVSNGYVSQHVALARPLNQIRPRWLGYFILSNTAKTQLTSSGYGGTKIQLSLEDIKEIMIALPTTNEQGEIAQYIDQKLAFFTRSGLITYSA
jgi:type I restriction enzyme S subunit